MRQVITLGAHIMNQNDQFKLVGSIINERTQHFQLATDKIAGGQTETIKWYKKRKKQTLFFFFTVQKLAQYFFLNQRRRVLQTGRCQKADSQTYEQKTLRAKTEGETERRTEGATETWK